MIDAGDPNVPEYQESVKAVLESENTTIDSIVVTHWHHDHIGGVPDLLRVAGDCKIYKLRRTDDRDEESFPITFMNDGDKITTEGATLK